MASLISSPSAAACVSPQSLIDLVPEPLTTETPAYTSAWYRTPSPATSSCYSNLTDHLKLFHAQCTKIGLLLTLLNNPTPYTEIAPLLTSTICDNLGHISAAGLSLVSSSPLPSLWKDVTANLNGIFDTFTRLLVHLTEIVYSKLAQSLTNNTSQSTLFIAQLQTHTSFFLHSSYEPSSPTPPTPRSTPLYSNRTYLRRSLLSTSQTLATVVTERVTRDNKCISPTIPTKLYYEITGGDVFNDAIDNTPVGEISTYVNVQPVIEGEELYSVANMCAVFNCYALIDAAVVLAVIGVVREIHGQLTATFKDIDEAMEMDGGRAYVMDEACGELTTAVEDLASSLAPASLDVELDGDTYVNLVKVVEIAERFLGKVEGVELVEGKMEEARMAQASF